MNILLTSADNPNTRKFGGKHIHLTLLEKGLGQLDNKVATTFYPPPSDMLLKLWRLTGRDGLFQHHVSHMLKFFNNVDYSPYDIINCHDVIAAAKAKGNIVLTLHGYFARESLNYNFFSEREQKNVSDFAMSIERMAVDKAKAIIAVDNRIKDYVIEQFNFSEKRIFTIYNSVNTDDFTAVPKIAVMELRRQYGVPEDNLVVLVPRRYVKKNGVIFAAQALRILQERKVSMIFAGSGPEKENLIIELQGDERAVVLDAIPHNEVINYYKMSDIVLVPSVRSDNIEEATSLSMLEGMACAKVVVCSNIGGMKEVIKSGETGILVEEKSPEQIAKAILQVQSGQGLAEKIGSAAREYVVKYHSYLQHARQFQQVFDMLAQE